MLVLAIDTSSAAVSAAVVEVAADGPPVVRAQRVTVDARAHAEVLAPSIDQCLAEAAAVPSDLAAVVGGVGPGPFTGLRVGLMTAAAMADALGVPAYGVCSLDAIGWAVGGSGPVLVAGDARRREVYWAVYVDGARTHGPAVDRPGEITLPTGRRTAGAGARLYRTVLGGPEGELLDCDHPPLAAVVALAADRIRSGAPSETLVPLYLRRPDAVPPAGRAGAPTPAQVPGP